MPLKLLSPRKTGRKFYYVRGVLCGKRYFESTKTTNKIEAEKRKEELERAIKSEYAGKASRMTFATASQRYIDYRKPSFRDEAFISQINTEIGDKFVDEIVQDDIVAAANSLYPGLKNSSKNRAVVRPSASILHYAAKNKWCEWLRIEAFKEPTPKTRYVSVETEKALHAILRKERKTIHRVFLLWDFRQSERISDILKFTYEDIDYENQTVRRHVSKSDRYETVPLDAIICRYLRRQNGHGRIFPWTTRWGPGKWIRDTSRKAGVYFTAHMARHTLGKRLNDSGAGLKTIMQVLGQKDPKSAIRYQSTGLEEMRQAKRRAK